MVGIVGFVPLGRAAVMRCSAAMAVMALLSVGHASHAASLEEALGSLVQTNPEILAGRQTVNSANQRIRAATALFLPTVSLTTDVGVENVSTEARRDVSSEPFRKGRERVTLNVTQNIFDGLRRNYDRLGAEYDKEVAAIGVETTTQNVLFQGVNAYVDVLRQLRLIDLIRANEEAVQKQFELEDQRVRAGAGLAVDLLLARSRLQLAKERRVLFNTNVRDAFSRYRQVFGEPPDPSTMTEPIPPIDLLPTTLEQAIEDALVRNPVIAGTSRQVDSTRARQRAALGDLMPRIDLVGAANFEEDVNASPGVRRDWSVLLQASWNLFSGFAVQANAASAAFDHAATLNNLALVNRRVEEELRFAWQGLQTGCERRFLLQNAVNISLDVLDSRRRLQEAGQETALRVLDAETELFNAQINLASASFDETLTVYRVVLALGRLDTQSLSNASAFARSGEGENSLIDWCEQYAGLEFSADDPFLSSAPQVDDSDPFAAPADEDALDEDPFADPPGDEDGDEGDDPFGVFDDDDDAPSDGAQGTGVAPQATLRLARQTQGPAAIADDDDLSDGRDGMGEPVAANLSRITTLPVFAFETDDEPTRTNALGI